MRRLTVQEFHAEIRAQGAADRRDIAFKCPICRTVQSARDLIAAGAGENMDAVEKFLGFSCVGRFTDAGEHKRGAPAGNGCNWTLGGLFQLHELEVVTEDGKGHPRFELASAEETAALCVKHITKAAA